MRDYKSLYVPPESNSEEIVFDKCEKTQVKINGSTDNYNCIMNDANEWQTDVDMIFLVKKSDYSNLKTGYTFTVSDSGKSYITFFDTEDRDFFTSAKCRLCTHTLSVIKNTISLAIPCIVSKQLTWGLEDTRFFQLPSNQIYVTIPNTSDTQLIDYNDVFQIGNRSKFEVIAIDDVTKGGLIVLTMQNTNKEIVAPSESLTSYSISSDITITGSDTIPKGKTSVYTSNIPCTWELTNEDGSTNEYVSIVSQDSTSITLLANNTLGESVILKSISSGGSILWSDNSEDYISFDDSSGSAVGNDGVESSATKTIAVVGLF